MPNNWTSLLQCSKNKTELFRFLSEFVISQMAADKLFLVTYNGAVLVNQNIDRYNLMPYTIEEADDRMFVHASDTAKAFNKLLIKTVDSDVVFMEISAFRRVVGLSKFWI